MISTGKTYPDKDDLYIVLRTVFRAERLFLKSFEFSVSVHVCRYFERDSSNGIRNNSKHLLLPLSPLSYIVRVRVTKQTSEFQNSSSLAPISQLFYRITRHEQQQVSTIQYACLCFTATALRHRARAAAGLRHAVFIPILAYASLLTALHHHTTINSR